ncbi:MAG: GAF domain-containing sensor histidine kinase [Anaerolineales bacterium]|nr:GAF domain-containing sensor histidine kinase [Anaerolineales bacterium]
MPEIYPPFTLHTAGILLYLVLMIVSFGQRGIRDKVARYLIAFLGVSLILEAAQLLVAVNMVCIPTDFVTGNLGLYGILIQSILLFNLNAGFLRKKLHWLRWAAVVIVLGGALSLDYVRITAPYFLRISSQWMVPGLWVLRLSLAAAWGLYMLFTVWRSIQTYRQTELILTRSRIRYWFLGLVLILCGDVLFLLGQPLIGRAFKFGGALVVSFIVLNTRLPDLKGAFKQSLYTFFALLLELGLYSGGILVLLLFYTEINAYSPFILSVGLGLVLLIIFNPLNRYIKKVLARLILGVEKDYSQVLREYSKKISNILDLELLSKVIFELISVWVEAEKGTIFTVDSEVDEEIGRGYRLKNVQQEGEAPSLSGFLSSESPITKTFLEDNKSLTLSEIEMLPRYKAVSEDERNWFKGNHLELFVPIFGMDEWIGLLALWPKNSGASYSKADIRLLETLADQTSVALQNARLVESIVRVNHEFQRAYAAMEEAHTKLERLERTKSDFISISSHELRTPLTVLSGYSQMLKEDPNFAESDYYKKVIKGINEGTNRLHEIVDSMLEIAKIDTRALELQSEAVLVPMLIHQVTIDFKGAASERKLNVIFKDLEELPPVFGDPEALIKVFNHLISNAIKYTPDGGKITITGAVVPQGDTRFQAGGVEIIISDTGIGIDPRYKELIFTKFYQTGELSMHSTGKTKFKGGGPGLGLAIVHGIIQAHGGRVWAESAGYDEENSPGSNFHVILPAAPDSKKNSGSQSR